MAKQSQTRKAAPQPEVVEGDAQEVSQNGDDPEVAPAPGVFIQKITQENGDVLTDVVPIGSVQATEVQTLIELGLASWRGKIGL